MSKLRVELLHEVFGKVGWEHTVSHMGLHVPGRDGLRAVRCFDCGYAHRLPLPTQAELDQFYDIFYQDAEQTYEQEERQQWYWRLVYQERLRHFLQYAPKAYLTAPQIQLLDYGAGVGRFVDAVIGRASVYGYEPNRWAADQNMRVHTRHAKFDGKLFQYEGCHCSLVLEHVLEPEKVLRQIARLLVPQGILCLVVPNEFNPLQERLKKRFGYFPVHEAHVNYFTQDSLAKLAFRHGFTPIDCWHTFPIEWFALHGLNYVEKPHLGAVAHQLRMRFEAPLLRFLPGLMYRLRKRWARKGIGREIVLWARLTHR